MKLQLKRFSLDENKIRELFPDAVIDYDLSRITTSNENVFLTCALNGLFCKRVDSDTFYLDKINDDSIKLEIEPIQNMFNYLNVKDLDFNYDSHSCKVTSKYDEEKYSKDSMDIILNSIINLYKLFKGLDNNDLKLDIKDGRMSIISNKYNFIKI